MFSNFENKKYRWLRSFSISGWRIRAVVVSETAPTPCQTVRGYTILGVLLTIS